MCSRSSSLAKVAVVDPFQAVRGDLPLRLLHGGDGLRGCAAIAVATRIDGDRDVALGESAPQPPEAGARAVFVDRLHVHVALAGPGLRADDLRQERLGGGVAVQDVVLAALLVVDDELHRDHRAARPFRVGRVAAVADHVARIVHAARMSATLSATTEVAAVRSESFSFSSARWPLASRNERGPAP